MGKKEFILHRLKIYHDETEKIFSYYNHLKVDGEQSIEKVREEIFRGLGVK